MKSVFNGRGASSCHAYSPHTAGHGAYLPGVCAFMWVCLLPEAHMVVCICVHLSVCLCVCVCLHYCPCLSCPCMWGMYVSLCMLVYMCGHVHVSCFCLHIHVYVNVSLCVSISLLSVYTRRGLCEYTSVYVFVYMFGHMYVSVWRCVCLCFPVVLPGYT